MWFKLPWRNDSVRNLTTSSASGLGSCKLVNNNLHHVRWNLDVPNVKIHILNLCSSSDTQKIRERNFQSKDKKIEKLIAVLPCRIAVSVSVSVLHLLMLRQKVTGVFCSRRGSPATVRTCRRGQKISTDENKREWRQEEEGGKQWGGGGY
ncbi:uncharacterized protein LOC126624523 isoform X2 [Malus sylvestris]|uniref:uncharacterized protein LOC126624523 isoform X2 n=1 Tax=Malus sylvestris TaxID=3752 RepID=UPI0021ACCCB1|nr:uncharacterized protein LOC126624523 isoform X2 [Malus sylvestris]